MSTLFLGGPPIGCDSMTITYPFIEAVEAQAGRSIEMETRLSDTSLANCHAQQQSRLFTLPPELRNVIFELATQPDSATPECDYIGNSTDSYHLPGDVWSISPSTVLPQICRRAWLESNFLPLKYAEHIFEIRGSEMLGSVESQCLSLSGQDELKRLICTYLTTCGNTNCVNVGQASWSHFARTERDLLPTSRSSRHRTGSTRNCLSMPLCSSAIQRQV